MKTTHSLIISLLTFSLIPAFAGQITKASGTQALVDLQGDAAEVGDEFYAVNSAGKKVALMSVKTVKGGRALMTISKGKASAGDTTQAKIGGGSSGGGKKSEASDSEPVLRKSKETLAGGFLVGYAMNTMSMTVASGTSRADVSMTDSSFSVKFFGDYDLSPTITFRGATGYETFNAKGTIPVAICGGSTGCTANYSYLPVEGSGHYNFMTGKTKAWVGIGYSYLIEISRNVNIPNLNADSKTNQMLLFSLGADFKSGKNFIPVVLEYAMFPGSANVKASAIYLRAGYGFPF